MHVIATAGHVDHGKSTLVLALTGIDPDRFEEEKRRGLTIDLGFAWTTLPSGQGVSFVDVPGHVRFIKNMLAGVGAVDLCLFVVAATEVWKPQSEEHLRILQLLGIEHGVIALTKVDLVDDDTRTLAQLEIVDRVAGTFLEDADIVEVAAPAGQGLDALRAALDRCVASTPTARDRERPRLWVDRVFAARGAGTVVTGTLTGGSLSVDDETLLVPGNRRARVRGLQSLGKPLEHIGPGNRLAVNLSGLERSEVVRGDAIVKPDQWRATTRFDASLHVLDSLDHDLSAKGAYVVYVGSGEHPAKVRVVGGTSIKRGTSGLVRLHLLSDDTALPLLPGDRFVLRESGRAETVGGGEVLDIDPVRPVSKAKPSRDVDRVIDERGWVSAHDLELLTGERRPPTIGRWIASATALDSLRASLVERVRRAPQPGLDLALLDDREREVVLTLDGIAIDNGRVRPAGAHDGYADHPFVQTLAAEPFTPPSPEGVDRATLRELVRRGLVVERDGLYFASSAIEEAARVAARLVHDHPDGFTVAEARDAFGATRKHALPLLAELDARGVTRRRGDVRVAGPRLPTD